MAVFYDLKKWNVRLTVVISEMQSNSESEITNHTAVHLFESDYASRDVCMCHACHYELVILYVL